MIDPLDAARRHLASAGTPAWLVGGRLRDALLGRPGLDTDVVVPSGALDVARALARAEHAAFVPLDRRRGYARVVWPGDDRAILDITDMAGGSLEADLRARDFTINALAVPLREPLPPAQATIVDPTGGLADLHAGQLRATSPAAFDADPLRLLRGVRLAATLGMALDPGTRAAIAARADQAARPAGERVREELARLLGAADPAGGLADLASLGLLEAVLPEAGVGASLAVDGLRWLAWFESRVEARGPEGRVEARGAAPDVGEALVERALSADRVASAAMGGHPAAVWTRLALLMTAAGIEARRDARRAVEGTTSPRPARRARDAARAATWRIRLGGDEAEHVERIARLAAALCDPEGPPRTSRRAAYRAFRCGGPRAADAAAVAVALARTARMPRAERIEAAAAAWLSAWLDPGDRPLVAPPLLDGRALMAALSLDPGPRVGQLLGGLREAQAMGEVSTEAEALAWARERVGRGGEGG